MKKLLALLLSLVMVLSLAACGDSGEQGSGSPAPDNSPSASQPSEGGEPAGSDVEVEPLTILFNSTFKETETGGVIVKYFADTLSELSGGKITVNVQPAGTLFQSPDELDAVSSGAVQMCALGHNPHAATLKYLCMFPDFAPDSTQNALDFFSHMLFENPETSAILEAEATANNIKYLNVCAGGANTFAASFDFDDLDSLVAGSSAFGNMEGNKFSQLGFTVVEMLPFDMYDFFDRGAVDATQMALAPMIDMKVQEVTTAWMLDNTYTAGNFFTVNLDWWNGLSTAQQDLIQQAATATQTYSATMYDDAIAGNVQNLKDADIHVVEMNDEDFGKWWDAVFMSCVNNADLSDPNAVTILQAAADFTHYDAQIG